MFLSKVNNLHLNKYVEKAELSKGFAQNTPFMKYVTFKFTTRSAFY